MGGPLEEARTAFGAHRWGDAWRLLSEVPLDELGIDDLDRLATSAYLTGRDEEGFGHWTRAHQACVADGAVQRAARFGVKLAAGLGFKGDLARCRGWADRTARLLAEADLEDCVEKGYLHDVLAKLSIFESGDFAAATDHFRSAVEIGTRFGERELLTLSRIGQGRMRIYSGEIASGIAMLDEAMVAIEAGDLSSLVAGDSYCTVIDACSELSDVQRCRSWTDSFVRWCDTQQELVLYRGHCFLHRAEVLGVLGDWPTALTEARLACTRLAEPVNAAALGGAWKIEGDLQRLSGDLSGAEASYRHAAEFGSQPQPGLALLRVAQGRLDAAEPMIRRALAETQGPIFRARLLGAFVDIVLAAGDVDAARDAAQELTAVAAELGTPYVRADAARATGAVLLASDDATSALIELRRAFKEFHELGAQYDAARTRELLARACDALGDGDSASIESAAAAAVFASLGVTRTDGPAGSEPPDGLTHRELEVLLLLARGKTNRLIATELFISEKTVASHVSHIFTKLGVTSRAAATAYAYDHNLVV